jgi:hypothetical protein
MQSFNVLPHRKFLPLRKPAFINRSFNNTQAKDDFEERQPYLKTTVRMLASS